MDGAERNYALAARAWPFEEARKLMQRFKETPPAKGYVLFETGYGPSGLPHIGTFGEVVRTTMVRQAFRRMSDLPTRLFAFSDDMDGLRKVPDNIPNAEMLRQHLGQPLTRIPDPFGKFESFGHHNNAMLRRFLANAHGNRGDAKITFQDSANVICHVRAAIGHVCADDIGLAILCR